MQLHADNHCLHKMGLWMIAEARMMAIWSTTTVIPGFFLMFR